MAVVLPADLWDHWHDLKYYAQTDLEERMSLWVRRWLLESPLGVGVSVVVALFLMWAGSKVVPLVWAWLTGVFAFAVKVLVFLLIALALLTYRERLLTEVAHGNAAGWLALPRGP